VVYSSNGVEGRRSTKFGLATNLRFHWFYPQRPPLRRLERFGLVAGVPKHLRVVQLVEQHHVEYLRPAVVVDPLDYPQPSLTNTRRRHIDGGVG
jgi:hypothetical protein